MPDPSSKPSPAGSRSPLQRLRQTMDEYPGQFWVLVSASFIDRIGGAMLFPFFTLYLTAKFAIGMTEVGGLFFLLAVSSMIGNVVGGALTDRLGRKGMLLFGLVMSAFSALLMGFINDLTLFFIVIPLVGILSDSAGPAHQALVADLLPEHKRAQGYGILRVVHNLAVVIGPLIGGLLASRDYLLLFIIDAITSSITAIIVLFTLQETYKPGQRQAGEPQESMLDTFKGYAVSLRDTAFIWFLLASTLMALVYIQMNSTLAVYLRDQHGVNTQGFSYILALNAAMVVLMQFPITRRITRYRPLLIMALGTLLYAIGFAMYGFVATFPLFLLAMVIITVGEMFVSPVGQAIVAQLAPEEMRGRYMATYGFSWMIPFMIGPLMAGLVIDNLDPRVLWWISGGIGLAAALLFYLLGYLVDQARWSAIDRRLEILQDLEAGQVTAEAAGRALNEINEGSWARLAPQVPPGERRHVRIKVSDKSTGQTKVDLSLPAGLVSTVLFMGGQFSPALDIYPQDHLHALLANSTEMDGPHHYETGEDQVDVHIE
ncbi:MAG: MDR family MFS transporter [Chloroflexota bacterium]